MTNGILSLGVLCLASVWSFAPAWGEAVERMALEGAVSKAKSEGRDMLVLVYGPEWDKKGMAFQEGFWKDASLDKVADGYILTEIPYYQNPTEEQKAEREKNKGILNIFPQGFPALFLVASDGQTLGVLYGEQLTKDPKKAASLLKEKIEARARQKELLTKAESASGVEKAKLLGQTADLGLERPNEVLPKIKEADPEDALNYVKRFELNTWAVIGKINETKDLAEAKALAKTYTDQEGYTPLQKQEIWASIIGRMRREDATNKDDLRKACLAMKQLDPKSMYGTAADATIARCCDAKPEKKDADKKEAKAPAKKK